MHRSQAARDSDRFDRAASCLRSGEANGSRGSLPSSLRVASWTPWGRCPPRLLVAVVPLLWLLWLNVPALAASGYITAPQLAKAHGLEYRDLSEGIIRACKLVGNGHEVILFADLRNILIDGSSTLLTYPVRWDGRSLLVPVEADAVLARHLGKPAHRPDAISVLTQVRRGRFKVVIDPGHGGKAPGAVGRSGLLERDVNLDISRRLAAYLEARGVKVVLTRRKDVFISLAQRVQIANRERPDLFLSIHANAEVSRSQHGAMSLYPDDGTRDGRPGILGRAKRATRERSTLPQIIGAGGPVGKAALLAVTCAVLESYRIRSIQAAHHIQESLAPVTGCVRRANGIIEDFRGLRVLRGTQAPAVLVEVDFISNRRSERKLRRASYRAAIAQAIGGAVIKFLENSSATPDTP